MLFVLSFNYILFRHLLMRCLYCALLSVGFDFFAAGFAFLYMVVEFLSNPFVLLRSTIEGTAKYQSAILELYF